MILASLRMDDTITMIHVVIDVYNSVAREI